MKLAPVSKGNAARAEPLSASPWVVICSRTFLLNAAGGSSAYVLSIADYLRSLGFRVAFLALSPNGFGVRPCARLGAELGVFDDYRINGWMRLGCWVLRIDSPLPWLAAAVKLVLKKIVPKVARWLPGGLRDWLNDHVMSRRSNMSPASTAELRFADRHIQRLDPAAVYINYFYIADVAALPRVSGIPSYVLTHSVFFDRSALYEKKNVRSEHPVIEQFTEITALAKADTVVAIQQTDAEILSRFLPVGSVVTAPMAMSARQNNAVRVSGRCLFVGGDSQTNTLGLLWFLEHVWPRVLAAESPAHLRICGDVNRSFSAHFPNVTFVGRVADLAPEYDSALVCVVPLVVGSGLKIKLVEALCNGRTGVATSVGVQGLHFGISEIVAVADEPVEFAAEVVDLLRNDARRSVMEAMALNFGQQHFLAYSCYPRLNPSFHPKVFSRAGPKQ
jgi:glycosyltransferase involved in cell wall biosynthesis